MGITDKITGRLKQAAGDLAGSDALRRQGAEEERKADAQAESAREEMRAERERVSADAERERAQARADQAKRRAYEEAHDEAERAQARADAVAERHEQRAERAEERAERKAGEARGLEHATDPDALAEDKTKDELYEEAQDRDIPGRSEMTKDELADAVRRER